jgi:hypothetical protein
MFLTTAGNEAQFTLDIYLGGVLMASREDETNTNPQVVTPALADFSSPDPNCFDPENKPESLYHYTSQKGYEGIRSSNELWPSTKAANPLDARYGNGQYFSDIVPGTKTPAQLSRSFINNPFQGNKFDHYVEIDVSDLNVSKCRDNVYLIPNEGSLNLTGRIINGGKVQ